MLKNIASHPALPRSHWATWSLGGVCTSRMFCTGVYPTRLNALCLFLSFGISRAPTFDGPWAGWLCATSDPGPSVLVAACTLPPGSRRSSSCAISLVFPFGLLAMTNTPANVAAQPYRNVNISWNEVRRKSPYRTADPTTADSVKNTNWVGMTILESKRFNARLRYRI